jgi:hypothetical protein
MTENFTYLYQQSRTLKVDMTDADKVEIADQLVEKQVEFTQLMLQKAEIPKQIKEVQKEIEALTDQYEKGFIHKEVECEWRFDFDKWTKTLYRLDTEEIIDKDVMISVSDLPKDEYGAVILLKRLFTNKETKEVAFPVEAGKSALGDLFGEARANLIVSILAKETFNLGDDPATIVMQDEEQFSTLITAALNIQIADDEPAVIDDSYEVVDDQDFIEVPEEEDEEL